MKKIYFRLQLALLIVFGSASLNAQLITLGSGNSVGGTTTAGPVNEYYRSMHCQMVYTAAEISAAGGSPGTMSRFGFYISSGVTNPLPNFSIKMKNTSATNVATYDGAGLTQVYSNASYNPVAGGFDLLTLTTPFVWNGTNILVDVCFDQVSAFSSTGQVRLYSSPVPNGFIYIRLDTAPQCGVACNTVSTGKPQAQMDFPLPLDLGVSAFVNPLASKPCFGNDTIRVRVKNYGSLNFDFSTYPTAVTVKTTGPVVSTYTLLLSSGVLNAGSTLDTALTYNFNMASPGTYHFKGYTSFIYDGSAVNDTATANILRKPFFTLTTSPNDSVCKGTPVQINTLLTLITSSATVGTGTLTNSSTTYPAPYGNFYNGAKNQFLFLASELAAAGVTPGSISSIGFNVVNTNAANPLTNFGISMGSTTLGSLVNFQTGLTPVYSTALYAPVTGVNAHALSTPFFWNGTDNVIVETCFNNYPNGFSSNASVSQSTTTFTSALYYRSDTDPTLCSTPGAPTTANQRPNITFGQPPSSAVTYSWAPAGAGLSATNIPNPVSNSPVTQTYTVTASVGSCMTYDTLRIVIKQTPTLNLGHDTTVCTASYLLNGGTNASSYQWSTGSTSNTIAVSNSGTYYATATSSVGCVKKDTVNVQFSNRLIVTLGPDTGFCQGSFVTLYSGNAGQGHSWTKQGGGFSSSAPSVNINTPGTYYAADISSLSASCNGYDTINVVSKTSPNVSLFFNAPPLLLCQFNTPRPLNEGTPPGGNYIGPGVNGNVFDPALVGPGNYQIVYNYTASNGCKNQAIDTLRVKACVGIEAYENNAQVSIYPNPNSGAFVVSIHSDSELKTLLTIMTVDGRTVYQEEVPVNAGLYEKQLDISSLSAGIYYLKMTSGNMVKTLKLIRQ